MGRLRAFADRTQHQAGAGAVQKPDQPRGQGHRDVDHGMLAEQRRPDKRQVAQPGNHMPRLFRQLFLHVADADKGGKSRAEQAERQPGRVLVGVEPDHQHTKDCGQPRAGGHAGGKAQPAVAGVHHGGKTGDGGAEHHAFGAQIHDAGLFVDQQAQRGNRQHRARAQRGGNQERMTFHGWLLQSSCFAGATVEPASPGHRWRPLEGGAAAGRFGGETIR